MVITTSWLGREENDCHQITTSSPPAPSADKKMTAKRRNHFITKYRTSWLDRRHKVPRYPPS
jgi:hypothetical protein